MNLLRLLQSPPSPDALLDQIRTSASSEVILRYLREAAPGLTEIPETTYSLYRQFALNGERSGYEKPYFAKRAMLTRAVVEMILGDESIKERVHDLLWSICEETSWVLPAHEKLEPTLDESSWLVGSNSSLMREPDYIDLFAAETGASLAETLHLLGERLSPEVTQRARQEIERRIFRPYLAYARSYWWHTGNLNWNAVCNGAVGLAFMRLEQDPRRLAESLQLVLEGFDAYLATGFEPDGGSLEGISYWNYGLLYYVTLAELLKEKTAGQLDLLANPRLVDVARFPLAMALPKGRRDGVSPGRYLNFGDAEEHASLQPGIAQRLAERTGVSDLRGLVNFPTDKDVEGYSAAKLAIVLRDIAWWDGKKTPFPADAQKDHFLPACAVVKLNGVTAKGQPISLAAKAGSNDGHHHHMDIGHFIVTLGEESLLCDPGRGLYSRDYFGARRFENIFCNSFGHSVPRMDGRMQQPGPRFGGGSPARGEIVQHGEADGEKFVGIDIAPVYDLPTLTRARRMLRLANASGEIRLEDDFAFAGEALEIEEAFVTWETVSVEGAAAKITGRQGVLLLKIEEPSGMMFVATRLEQECRANECQGVLTRLTVNLPVGTRRFVMRIRPV